MGLSHPGHLVEPLRLAGTAPGHRRVRPVQEPADRARNLPPISVSTAAAWSRSRRSFISVISVHAAVRLAQELLTMREMGIPESFVNLIEESISAIVNLLLALGLWLAHRWARWLAIAWYLLLSVIAVIVSAWLLALPGGRRSQRWWPEYLAGKLMPLFLLVVMFLPRVRTSFCAVETRERAGSRASCQRTAGHAPGTLVGLLTDRVVILDRGRVKPGCREPPIGSNGTVTDWNQSAE